MRSDASGDPGGQAPEQGTGSRARQDVTRVVHAGVDAGERHDRGGSPQRQSQAGSDGADRDGEGRRRGGVTRRGTTSTSASAPSGFRDARAASRAGRRRPPASFIGWLTMSDVTPIAATPVSGCPAPLGPPTAASAPATTNQGLEWLAKSDSCRSGTSSTGVVSVGHGPVGGAVGRARAAAAGPTPVARPLARVRRSSRSASSSSTGSGVDRAGRHRLAPPGGPARYATARPACRGADVDPPAARRAVERRPRQPHGEGAGPDGEAQRRLQGQGLAVDADLDGPPESHLELRGGPLVPAGEPPHLPGGLQGGELLRVGGATHQHRDDAEHAAVEAGPGAAAPQVGQLVGVVGDQEQLGRRPASSPDGRVKRRSSGVASGPSRSGSIAAAVWTLASRYSADWTILA